ncbi:MAG: aldo/keto reductase [Bryobacteraceae bacterium]
MPTRTFGRTGMKVSLLAIGCGNRLYMAYGTVDRAVEAVRLALDSGINYLDTAQAYGDGTSETWVGIATKDRRKDLVLASKTTARTADDVLRRVELSLKRLQTSYLDVLHIHGLNLEDDLAVIEAKGGALEALYKLRDQKVVRFVGVTSHMDPVTLAKALDRHDFDCTQMALNAGLQGRSPDGAGFWKKNPKDFFSEGLPPRPFPGSSFEDVALPVAARKNLGIVAMKVTAQEGLIGSGAGKASAHDLLRYALSLPVSIATVGMPKLEFIRINTEFARGFRPMPAADRKEMASRIASANKVAIDRHFSIHEDA